MTDESTIGAAPRLLRAGALAATLDGSDLTHIRLGATEVVRRILITVRDVNWDTLQAEVLSSSMRTDADRFEIALEGRHIAGEIDFRWSASIRADSSGRVVFALDGRAASEFTYNRIGLCVLHPVSTCAGAAYRSSSSSGSHSGVLSAEITPQVSRDGVPIALFPECDALELRPGTGGRINFAFAGDLFEMEDQRNWTDDSFKTYCTPASLGGPHRASRDQVFRQSVEVEASGFDIAVREPDGPVKLELGSPSPGSMPSLGLAMGSALRVPTEDEARELRRLGLGHIRADVELDAGSLDEDLQRAINTCERTDAALELALHLESTDEPLLARIEAALSTADVPVARVLAFHRLARAETSTETSAPALVIMVRRSLGHLAPVGGGTNMDFAELNRTHPDPAAMDIVAWSMNAQVHASDDSSVMETLRGQVATLATARSFSDDRPFAVGPITLKARFNPAATGPPVAVDPDGLPAHVDPRQATPFCAAWAAGSVAGLAYGGAASLTYFELVGMAGVMLGAEQAGHPEFVRPAGPLFPVYHALEALAPLRGQALLRCHVSPEDGVAALATEGRVVVANLTPVAQQAAIGGLPWPTGSEVTEVNLAPYEVSVLQPATTAG
jgi:D-apionolactonase